VNGPASTLGIVVVAVFFLGMGVYAFIAPAHLVAPFHLRAATPEGRSEVRAVYGGFGIAVAAMLGAAAFDVADFRPGIVVTVAAALAGMALGRVVSRSVGDRPRFYPVWFYCCVEAAGAAILLTSL
jgi:hypothetical protein